MGRQCTLVRSPLLFTLVNISTSSFTTVFSSWHPLVLENHAPLWRLAFNSNICQTFEILKRIRFYTLRCSLNLDWSVEDARCGGLGAARVNVTQRRHLRTLTPFTCCLLLSYCFSYKYYLLCYCFEIFTVHAEIDQHVSDLPYSQIINGWNRFSQVNSEYPLLVLQSRCPSARWSCTYTLYAQM